MFSRRQKSGAGGTFDCRDAETIVAAARAAKKALLVGYILRVHPSWTRFVEIGRTLGKPLVMRMNLNQQWAGSFWEVHGNLMKSTSPIVDCGVHYVDVMCQATRAKPVLVHAVGARLTDEIAPGMVQAVVGRAGGGLVVSTAPPHAPGTGLARASPGT